MTKGTTTMTKPRRVRVLMDIDNQKYITAADLLNVDGDSATITRIAGMENPRLEMTINRAAVLGRKRGGRRGRRQRQLQTVLKHITKP